MLDEDEGWESKGMRRTFMVESLRTTKQGGKVRRGTAAHPLATTTKNKEGRGIGV